MEGQLGDLESHLRSGIVFTVSFPGSGLVASETTETEVPHTSPADSKPVVSNQLPTEPPL